ncbi:DgyrCDS8999 [Dimorphilus gyrociliatus]|uniref:DgyrCDS8999 n=1 Tax=Dimorphilus gyrociliatus TaxID=2664684 RepID=A0A7I8VVS9_9ANNE|nr:DgyrCDS8999 [Dimorphilus gyrociliatus]
MPPQEKISIFDKCRDAWRLVCREVKRASVYLDAPSIESLHWCGGIDMLYQNGAAEVKQFNMSESSSQEYQKAVFILSSLIEGEISRTLRNIIQCSNFQYIILISAIPPAMHTTFNYGIGEANENRSFTEMETTLCDWMGNMNYTVEVMYIPFAFCNILPELVILPQDGNFMPLLSNELEELIKAQANPKNDMKITDLDFTHLMKEGQLQYKLLVTAIDSLLQQLGICEDIYSMGFTSKAVASELASLQSARQRRKNNQQLKASMLIVDRTADILSAAGHRQDNLLDYCLNVLKPLEDHLVDVETDMSYLSGLHASCKYTLAPGCLSQPQCNRSKTLLKQMAYSKYDDALTAVLRNLIESASKENLLSKPPKVSRIGVEELKSILNLFHKKIETMKSESGVLQIAQSVIDALNTEHKRKQLLAAEKGILMAEEPSSALSQVNDSLKADLKRDEEDRIYTTDDYLSLLTFAYSAYNCDDEKCGNFERDIKLSLLELIKNTKEDNLPAITKKLIIKKTKGDQYKVLSDLFDKLKAISSFRNYFGQYREKSMIPSAATSVLQNIAKSITDNNKPELTDISHHATGFRQLLRTGFGFLTGATKARPGDQPILIFCVLGGITIQEVKSLVETISAANIQPIILSTNIIKSNSFISDLLNDHIKPETMSKYTKTFT